jgi:transcriptional regulator with XRE-family HTH domain
MARTTTTTESIGETLRAARNYRGLTLVEVGQRCGLAANALSRVERGKSSEGGFVNGPTTRTIAVLAKALNCSFMVGPTGHWTFIPN